MLLAVCPMRGTPIVTFVNKVARAGRPPLELLDEIERILGIPCTPMNWPVGSGQTFVGVYDRERAAVLRFERAEAGSTRAPMSACAPDDPELRATLGERGYGELRDEL